MKLFLLAFMLAVAGGFLISEFANGSDEHSYICISAVGPVDAVGQGNTTPALECR